MAADKVFLLIRLFEFIVALLFAYGAAL